ncbi:MAG: hypothetical protein GY845_00250 [Planctomycetes bacterium]|nr:hypothetical protein [Planctomycetota bacterium]
MTDHNSQSDKSSNPKSTNDGDVEMNKLTLAAWIVVKAVIAVALVLILGGVWIGFIFDHLRSPWIMGMMMGMATGAVIGILEKSIVVHINKLVDQEILRVLFRAVICGLFGATIGVLLGHFILDPQVSGWVPIRKVVVGIGAVIIALVAPQVSWKRLDVSSSGVISKWGDRVIVGMFLGTVLGLVGELVTELTRDITVLFLATVGMFVGMILGLTAKTSE